MRDTFHRYSHAHRDDALEELGAELREFSHDGLIELRDDLARGVVVRGSWAGCVISYKRGAPGSARRDRMGRARNAFTVLWDNGWLTDEDVATCVDVELGRRQRSAAAKVSAPGADTIRPAGTAQRARTGSTARAA